MLRSSENINTLPRLGRVYAGLYSNRCSCYVLVYQKRPRYIVGSIILPTQRRRMDSVRVSNRKQRQTNRQAAEDVSLSDDVWPEVIICER